MEQKLKIILNDILAIQDQGLESEFPIQIFPKTIQDIAEATSICSDYPIDYISASLLSASATSIGNTHSINVKNNWHETAILYLALVGNPGMNKSHPLSFAYEPLFEKDKKTDFDFRKRYKEYEQTKEMRRKEREELNISPSIEEPILKKIIVSDITAESLVVILQDNQRGLGVYADELGAWLNTFSRYNNGSDEPFWLSCYSAKPILINRKHMKIPISINKPFVNVIGTIQTGLLYGLAEGNKSKNGFMDRILFVFPKKQLKKYWSKELLPQVITNKWADIIERLLNLEFVTDEYNTPVPKIIKHSPNAFELLAEWQKYNTDLSNQESNDILKGIYSKLEIYISRFSLIIHMLRKVCFETDSEQIDIETVEKSIRLTEYFRKTAIRVQNSLNSSEVLKSIPEDKRELFKQLPTNFLTGDAISLGQKLGYSRDTINRFLKDYRDILFENYKHGNYRKLS